jgi:hypothetical protein
MSRTITDITETACQAIKKSWQENGQVTFPLYDAEAKAMAQAVMEAIGFRASPMWAVWNDCNGVFEVHARKRDAQSSIDGMATGYHPDRESVVPVRVYLEPNDDWDFRDRQEDEITGLNRTTKSA